MSAWAIMIRCCSPPERLPIRASANPLAPTASSISSTGAATSCRRPGDTEAVPVEAERNQIPSAQRYVLFERDLLRDIADRWVLPGPDPASHENPAGARRDQTEDHPQQGGLPRAVRSDQATELPGFELERHLVEHLATPERHGNVLDLQHRSERRPSAFGIERHHVRCGERLSAHDHRCWVDAPVVMAFSMAVSSAIIHVW